MKKNPAENADTKCTYPGCTGRVKVGHETAKLKEAMYIAAVPCARAPGRAFNFKARRRSLLRREP